MADNVIVIGKGKLIASTSIKDLVSSNSKSTVFVRSPNLGKLKEELEKKSVNLKPLDKGLEIISHKTDEIGKIAFDAGIQLSELSNRSASLEEVFLELTEGSEEFAGREANGKKEMMNTLKAEFKKLLTVRSTYFIFGFCVVLLVFFGFYVSGWRIDKIDLLYHGYLAGQVSDAVSTISVFAALIAVLLVTHEYRYNTIMYTLTASNSRSKVLIAKILVITSVSVVFTVFFGLLSPMAANLGIHAHHLKLVHQTFSYWNLLWRNLFYGWGYAMAGLLLAVLIRNQVGTIITLFIAPGVVEGLLSLLLKNNTVYCPSRRFLQLLVKA